MSSEANDPEGAGEEKSWDYRDCTKITDTGVLNVYNVHNPQQSAPSGSAPAGSSI